MIIVASEHIFLNPKLNKTNDIIDNTRLEHNGKYGDIFCGDNIEFKFNSHFFSKK